MTDPTPPLTELTPERLAEIKALRFRIDGWPPPRVHKTDAERQLYGLAAEAYAALQDLLADHQALTDACTTLATELGRWTGELG